MTGSAKAGPPEPASDVLAGLARAIAAAPPGGAADEEARLVRALAPRVRLYGLKHLRDAARADDLAQEVLLTTLERLRAGKIRDPERIVSFVLGTSRAMVIDLLRGERRRRELGELFLPGLGVTQAPREPLDLDRLAGCLDRLSARARAVVTMTFYAERDAAQIAQELTLSPGNVRVLRHRALEHLRGCMEGASDEVPS
ncbi:MAG TPA: sigma-70 family RNA polymerase sigma factor [Candidatus Polarisedimenticolaceae bacterium]